MEAQEKVAQRPAALPAVSQQEADALRQELQRHAYVRRTHRLPEQVLPDPRFISVSDQAQEGSSVGHGLAAALNYLRAEGGQQDVVSPAMLYRYAQVYDEWPGADYEGSSLAGGVAALMRHGVCRNSDWPSADNEPDPKALEAALQNRPSDVRRVERNVDDLRAALFEHHAVVVGASIHEGWMQPVDGEITFTGKQKVLGVHAFALLGYTPRGFVVQNSWGLAWGGLRVPGHDPYPGLALWTYEDAAANLQDGWVILLARDRFRPPLAGYAADGTEDDDLLEIRSEVQAFSYALASRAVQPPLALGLFGDWGSGKSFFMQAMQKKIEYLAGTAANATGEGEPRFCRRVVQIRFNAWHYLDADLWASLVTEIFDKLFASIGGKPEDPEARLRELQGKLSEADGVYRKAQQQLSDAEAARTAAERILAEAISRRETRESSIVTQLDDLTVLLSGHPAVRREVDALARELGRPELETSFAALQATALDLRSLGGRAAGLLEAMFVAPWPWRRLAGLVAAVCAPVIVVLAVAAVRTRWPQALDNFHSFALQVTAFVGAITSWLAAQARRGSLLLAKVEGAHRDLERIRSERRSAAVAQQEGELQAMREKEDAARKTLQAAEQRVQALRQEVADLQPGRLIMRFIEERSRSADYRSRLGIVSLVRRDFERLSELAARKDGAMPVDRVILYVDDLDRCRPDRVVEVLEAVHLLLAFPLFMVVVAVDPRWLQHALEQHYPDLLTLASSEPRPGTAGPTSRPATAQDYLEKIFQIPFALQPLQFDGYRRMVRHLVAQNVTQDAGVPASGLPSAAPARAPGDQTGSAAEAARAAAQRFLQQVDPTPRGRTAAGLEPAREEDADDGTVESLNIRSWELQDMERLAALFRTTRAVKRFVNTYRFLRAGVRPHELPLFEGSADDPGTYRAVLLLLAVIVSSANLAPRLLRRIQEAQTSGHAAQEWIAFLDAARAEAGASPHGDGARLPAASPSPKAAAGAKPPGKEGRDAVLRSQRDDWEAMEWRQLLEDLRGVTSEAFPVRTVGELAPWVRAVGRYSFSLAAALPGR